ncbi:MAG: FHA domain-containing protein, partial [Gemmatimonadales bacterium]
MPYIRLVEPISQRVTESRGPVVRLGRGPDATVSFSGDLAKFVSTRHAELRYSGGVWKIVDVGSRNGTFVNGRRVTAETALALGDVISLGESGPRVSVAALADPDEETLTEARPIEARPYAVSLLVVGPGERLEGHGTRIRLGRGKECEIRVQAERGGGEADQQLVSRVHAELTAGPTGGLVLRDAGSKNGTFLNGERIGAPVPVRLGDRIMLGTGGPVLIVEGLGTAPVKVVPRAPAAASAAVGQQTVRALIVEA